MGSWSSDGVFAYSSVPIVAVEEASKSMNNQTVVEAVFRLKQASERTKPFLDLVHSFGPDITFLTLVAEGTLASSETA